MNKITSYRDLEVYQRAYKAALLVMREIVPRLSVNEKFDLKDQLSRSFKAVPRLIAEGFAKKHQIAGFQKYIDDAMAESNETQVGLCQCRDMYPSYVDVNLCEELIKEYDIISRQLYRLAEAWIGFIRNPKTKTNNYTSCQDQKPRR